MNPAPLRKDNSAPALPPTLQHALLSHRAGKLPAAEEAYLAAIAFDPACFEAQHFLSVLLVQLGRFGDAVKPASAAAQLRPGSPETLAVLGAVLSNVGRDQDALEAQDKLVRLRPESAETHYNRGVSLAKLGRHEEAVASYRRSLAFAPDNKQTYHNLGNSLIELGRVQEALAAYDGVVAQPDPNADSMINRGNALLELKRYDEALASYDEAIAGYDQALAATPELVMAFVNRGQALRELQRHGEALDCYEKALRLAPNHVEALTGKGLALDALERSEEALGCFDAALSFKPDDAGIVSERCAALHHLRRFDEALTASERAIALDPREAKAHYSLGAALHALGRYDEAAASYRTALELAPETGMVHKNLGGALLASERYDEAVASFNRAIELGAKIEDTLTNRSLAYLSLGQFERGWPEYRHRFKSSKSEWRSYPQPRWEGEALDGPLLVWGEQGLGDQILYSSMIPELPGRAGKIVLEASPRLVPLFARSFPDVVVVPMEKELYAGPVAAHIPCGTLGQYLRPSFDAFPHRPHGFLIAEAARAEGLRDRLAHGRLVVGLSWGSANKKLEKAKTAGLAAFRSVLQSPHCHCVDLQYGDTRVERGHVERNLGVRIEHLDDIDNTNDIDGLAALITACDVVVTVSNTTAHLAGALGRPTYVLVPYGQGRMWYWFHERDNNPFYASVHIRRQREGQSWAELIEPVARELSALSPAGIGVP